MAPSRRGVVYALGAALACAACGGETTETCTNHDGFRTVVCKNGHEPEVVARWTPADEMHTYTSYGQEELAEPRLVQDERFVYWVSGASELLRTEKLSGTTTLLLDMPGCGIVALEIAAGRLFSAVNCRTDDTLLGGVWVHPTDGGAGREFHRSALELTALAVAPNGSEVYILEQRVNGRVLVAVDPSTESATDLTLEERLRCLAVAPGYVYFGRDNYTNDPKEILRGEAQAGVLTTLGHLTNSPMALETSRDHLYLRSAPDGSYDNNVLTRAPLAAPDSGFTEAVDGDVPQWFMPTDTHVYAAGRYDLGSRKDDSTIVRFRLSDGHPEPLLVLKVGLRPSGVLVDDTHVYWVDYDEPFQRGNSRLVRTAR